MFYLYTFIFIWNVYLFEHLFIFLCYVLEKWYNLNYKLERTLKILLEIYDQTLCKQFKRIA